MQYQTSMTRGQPDDEAIKLLQFYEPAALHCDPRGYCVCYSGGKDSQVLAHLMQRAGVKHFYLHNITGIDPPELVYFQRRQFAQWRGQGYLCGDIKPRKTMWTLMIEKKIPPMRTIRYCCAALKERRTECQGKAILSRGVRKYASVNRAKRRDELEIARAVGRDSIIMPWDNGAERREFEQCYTHCERRVNPIARWTDADVWAYTQDVHLEQCSLYAEGFDRLGCIGCPMARQTGREREFARWPKFRAQYIRTFGRMIEARKAAGMLVAAPTDTAQGWFDWWMTDSAQEQADENQLTMEGS